jgi:hypothetical protein
MLRLLSADCSADPRTPTGTRAKKRRPLKTPSRPEISWGFSAAMGTSMNMRVGSSLVLAFLL